MPKKKFFSSVPFIIGIAIIAIFLLLFGVLSGPIGTTILGHQFGPSWLHVETPQPELAPGTLFNIGSFPVTNTMITAWITIVLIVLLTYFAFRKPKIVPHRSAKRHGICLRLAAGFLQERRRRKKRSPLFPVCGDNLSLCHR